MLALIGITYFLFATGPRAIFRVLPWFIWGSIFLDALLLIFWLAASATSRYNCSDLCDACGFAYDEVSFDNLVCSCLFLYKRDTSPAPKGLARSLERRITSNSRHYGGSTVGAKIGLDAIMTYVLKCPNSSQLLASNCAPSSFFHEKDLFKSANHPSIPLPRTLSSYHPFPPPIPIQKSNPPVIPASSSPSP